MSALKRINEWTNEFIFLTRQGCFINFIMTTLREEIESWKVSLDQLEVERRNLLQHLKIQEDNYSVVFKSYVEKVELLLKHKDNKIEELMAEKSKLEAFVLGQSREVTITKKPE